VKKAKAISIHAAQAGFPNIEQRAILNLPERALWVGVLAEALADLQRNKYRRPAVAWIKSNGQSVGSFVGFVTTSIWIVQRGEEGCTNGR